MTCVIAIVEGENVEAGADTAAGAAGEIYEMREDKVFIRGPWLIGYCGSARIGQILRYRLDLPDPPPDCDLTAFLIQEVGPAIRRAVEAEGAGNPGRYFLGDTTVLLFGCRGRLWCMLPDLTVCETASFAAIGSGRHHAYGALNALAKADVRPARRLLELALEAAADLTPTVRPPFRFVTLEGEPRPSGSV